MTRTKQKAKDMKQTAFRLSEETLSKLDKLADMNEMNRTVMLRIIIKEAYEKTFNK